MKKVSLDKGREIETPWLNVEEAAIYCGLARSVFWETASGIPSSGSGKGRKYKTADLDEWMKDRE